MKTTRTPSFETSYPNLTRWVTNFGSLEIGYDEMTNSFIRVIHPGGALWKGRKSYANLNAALAHAEQGAEKLLREEFS